MAASGRRKTNWIKSIRQEDGSETHSLDHIQELFLQYYSRFDDNASPPPASLSLLPGPRLSEEMASSLTPEITDDEIEVAVRNLPMGKAPGFDGLGASFYRNFWSIIKTEVCSAIKYCFISAFFPDSWKNTIICLTPKVEGPATVKDYRPISLCSFLYKICAKMLANRMARMLPSIIGWEQGAFIRGRSISDNILLAGEAHQTVLAATTLPVKIDMEKAFDRLSLHFLHGVLIDLGFPRVFANTLLALISNALISVLINGSLTKWIHLKTGVRQGCPLSPFLFITASENLSRLLHSVLVYSSFNGIRMSRIAPIISHLFFADDVLIFGEASTGNIDIMRSKLDTYCNWYLIRTNPLW